MKQLAVVAFAALVLGCGESTTQPSSSPSLKADAGNSSNAKSCQKDGYKSLYDAAGQPFKNSGDCTSYGAKGGIYATCSATNRAACLYAPASFPFTTVTTTLTDPDRAGGPRLIPIAIHVPIGAPTPMPIMLWAHGGADGKTNPLQSVPEWCDATAAAGYVSVCIAHVPRTPLERVDLCAFLGIALLDCPPFNYLNYDRPYDIKEVLDYVETIASLPAYAGLLDLDRIGVGGHSAGSGGVSMIAGVSREFLPGVPTLNSDPRPKAFLAFSPQGPTSEGFTPTSFGGATRPILTATGLGDITEVDDGVGRAKPYGLYPAGNKALLFINDPRAIHTTFEAKTDGCVNHSPLAVCEEFVDWIVATGLAYADYYIRGSPSAEAWLASSNIVVASAGVAQLSRR